MFSEVAVKGEGMKGEGGNKDAPKVGGQFLLGWGPCAGLAGVPVRGPAYGWYRPSLGFMELK